MKKTVLDRDLSTNRTMVIIPDPVELIQPSEIRLGETVTFIISNYDPTNIYEVWFSVGTWNMVGNKIIYTAPWDGDSPLEIRIKATTRRPTPLVIFRNGLAYTDDGIVKQLEFVDGKFIHGDEEFDDDFDDLGDIVSEIKNETSPVASTKPQDDPVELGEFKQSDLFGVFGSRYAFDKSRERNDSIYNYYVSSEINKENDKRRLLYNSDNNRFKYIPRNSNVTSSGGDVYNGYRKPRDPGGSLTVIKNPDELSKWFEFDAEVDLWPLEAVVPKEIIALCLVTLEVVPILRGIDIGHTYEWEQIAGDQAFVTWLTPKNQKDAVIDFGGVKVDRTFRFWISRHTKYERYYDMVVYGTPTDNVVSSPQHKWVITALGNHLNTKVHDAKPLLLDHERLYHKNLRVQVIRNY